MADCLDRFHRVLVLDPIAAPIVQRIFDMYVRPGLGHQDHCSTPDRRRHSVPVRSWPQPTHRQVDRRGGEHQGCRRDRAGRTRSSDTYWEWSRTRRS